MHGSVAAAGMRGGLLVRRGGLFGGTLVLSCALLAPAPRAWSQAQVPPGPAPRESPVAPAAAPITVEQLAERLSAMEQMNRKLSEELERTRREHGEQMRLILEKVGELSGNAGPRNAATAPGPANGAAAPPAERPLTVDADTPVPDYTEGQLGPESSATGFPLPNVPGLKRMPLKGSFGPGFQLETDDERFRLQVHYESQIEARIWEQSDQVPANSGIFLPRQRIFFNGNITKPIEYEFSINRGLGNLNLLNAYVNVHFDDRFEFRIGRFFTPLPYDQYAISNYWLPTPERSIFTTNVGLNRQFGAMGWGYLFDKRLDYAAGVFNGSRNSFESLNNGVDFAGYLNARPFQESDSLPFARFLNLGSSVAFGRQNQAPVPSSFRIAGGSPTADVPGPGTVPFLILNRDVIERGDRLVGSVHAAYFHKSLSLIGEWQYGYGGYALPGRPSTQVPFAGFYVTGAYFLTGEDVERRTRLIPLRPLIPTTKGGRRGLGAFEVVTRVSEFHLADRIFTAGFADPDLWSNSAITTEVGLNWYWNEYIKVYMFWLHGEFGDPVQFRPGGSQLTSDMFWLRFQLYF
jgi:phosphate-selective porin OprO and OprP